MPGRCKTSLTVADIRLSGKPPFRSAQEQSEALSLIRRLALTGGFAGTDVAPSAITLQLLTGGRSAARVFKLTPVFGLDRQSRGTPVVVKISPRAQGIEEKANYDQFVRRALPAHCRPELLGFARARTYSGLCYSFVGRAGESKITTLTHSLQRGDTAQVALVLRKIFAPLRSTWYSPNACRIESDIAQRYLARYFTGPRSTAKAEANLQACAARYFGARRKGERYVIGALSFPSPRALLFVSNPRRPYRSCIIHGDLNSDNIVISQRPEGVSFLDFQKTGRGHVHEDLIFIEASIRINYPCTASFAETLEQERLIALGSRGPRSDPYSASIRKIRTTASRYFSCIEFDDNYHFAAAAIGLRLMHATDLTHAARARITAATLWATKLLAGEC
jgi:hypothetical protein